MSRVNSHFAFTTRWKCVDCRSYSIVWLGRRLFASNHIGSSDAQWGGGPIHRSVGMEDLQNWVVTLSRAVMNVGFCRFGACGEKDVFRYDRRVCVPQSAIVSHTGVSAVHDHWRNVDDSQIKAIAERGVICIMYQSSFLEPTLTLARARHCGPLGARGCPSGRRLRGDRYRL